MVAIGAKGLRAWSVFAFAAIVSLSVSSGRAQDPSAKAPETAAAKAAAAKKEADAKAAEAKPAAPHDPVPDVEVTGVKTVRKADRKDTDVAALGDDILVSVSDLRALERAAAERGKRIILFFDNQPLQGVAAERWFYDTAGGKALASGSLGFNLHRHDESDEARATWASFVRQPQGDDRDVLVSVGLEGAVPQPVKELKGSPPSNFKLNVVNGLLFVICLVAFAAFAIVFGLFAFRNKSNMLRDSDAPVTFPGPPPYSLGRSQMAFWFFLVIAAYMLLWIVTGSFNTLTAGVLGLIGISAATTVSAALIDRSKDAPPSDDAAATLLTSTQIAEGNEKLAQFDEKLRELRHRINELAATSPTPESEAGREIETKRSELTTLQDAWKAERERLIKGGCGVPSEGFFRDILSDKHGVSFHRFQMAVWTVILGIIFVKEVYYNLAMPQFDPMLLGLMGISSGTYIGFKFKGA